MHTAPGSFAPGIYDISLKQYLADKTHVSSSMLRNVLRSPLHLRRYLSRRHDAAAQLDLGTAVHCALLEPQRFRREYLALPVQHTDLFHAEDLALMAQHDGPLHFITEAQMQVVQGICRQVEQLPEVVRMLEQGLAERSLFWCDEPSGMRCKIRPDLLVLPQLILELKTTFDASLAVFQRTCFMQRYHLSAAMYRQGVQQLTGQLPQYVYLVAGRHPPYAVRTFVPGAAMLQEGERLFRAALRKIDAEPDLRQLLRCG